MVMERLEFQSTLSLRRATLIRAMSDTGLAISIHALLAESDEAALREDTDEHYFNPRSPCGERRA